MENENPKTTENKNVVKSVDAQPENTNENKQSGNSSNFRKPRRRYPSNRRYPKSPKKTENTSESPKSKFPFSRISILVPLFNEEESLAKLTKQVSDVFNNIKTDYEILFVDDGSVDNSLKVIKDLARTNNKIRYISFRKNYGKSAALNIGFKNVTGDVVITMDADLQDDPGEIPNLLHELQKGYDLVSGWKKKRHDPFIKKYSSRFFNYVTKVMSGIKIHDFNCGLKAYRKNVVKTIDVHGELHRYIPVLADWKGFKISEVVVKHHPRKYGKTKFGISRFFKGFIDLITVIFTTRYIQRPLHFFGMLGVASFLIGFVIDAYLSILWFLHEINLSNRPILFLGTVLIIVGVQLFSLGLIGEMLVHNDKKEDNYGIKEKKLKTANPKEQK
ncbi:MAG: glycosyltransferase family 2 protein [Ignavibacteriae bacterium]|nr:glycosyltransferase family 2 protein [Ignavibacteriota bacterium]